MRLIDTQGTNAKVEISLSELGSLSAAYTLAIPSFRKALEDMEGAGAPKPTLDVCARNLERAINTQKIIDGLHDLLEGPDDEDYKALLTHEFFANPDNWGNPPEPV